MGSGGGFVRPLRAKHIGPHKPVLMVGHIQQAARRDQHARDDLVPRRQRFQLRIELEDAGEDGGLELALFERRWRPGGVLLRRAARPIFY